MNRPVRLHEEARAELVHAGRWAVREWPALATEFDRTVEAALASIGEQPEAHAPAPDSPHGVEARQALVGRFPYRVVFVARSEVVFVLAFAHKRQRPGYWKERAGTREGG